MSTAAVQSTTAGELMKTRVFPLGYVKLSRASTGTADPPQDLSHNPPTGG